MSRMSLAYMDLAPSTSGNRPVHNHSRASSSSVSEEEFQQALSSFERASSGGGSPRDSGLGDINAQLEMLESLIAASPPSPNLSAAAHSPAASSVFSPVSSTSTTTSDLASSIYWAFRSAIRDAAALDNYLSSCVGGSRIVDASLLGRELVSQLVRAAFTSSSTSSLPSFRILQNLVHPYEPSRKDFYLDLLDPCAQVALIVLCVFGARCSPTIALFGLQPSASPIAVGAVREVACQKLGELAWDLAWQRRVFWAGEGAETSGEKARRRVLAALIAMTELLLLEDVKPTQSRWLLRNAIELYQDLREDPRATPASVSDVSMLAGIAGLCNDATFGVLTSEKDGAERQVNGDATDTGLLRFADWFEAVESLRNEWVELGKIAFNSKNKYAVKLLKLARRDPVRLPQPLADADAFAGDDDTLLLVKGAPDILAQRCSSYVTADGSIASLDEQALATLNTTQSNFARQGQRVLLLAKKVIRPKDLNMAQLRDSPEETITALNIDLTIVGLVALVDPPRDDTKETVRICRRAGIRFMMVTGDFALTASSIAQQCGIITTSIDAIHSLKDLPRDLAITQIAPFDADRTEAKGPTSLVLSGSELITMTESQWKQAMAFDEVVFARTSPQQKLQIVRTFQEDGCTVAVTGDGVNDAPALKQADVGVCVAGGSEVAMEAADLILLDEFSAIVSGIESGRLCFENLRKTLLYLLPAGSFSELMPVLVNVIFGLPQALSNIQMILICVVTDVLPALSLVFEQPEADLLLRRPRNPRKEHLVDVRVLLQAYSIGILESLTAMTGAFYFGFAKSGIPFSSLWLQYGGYNLDPDELAYATNRAQTIYFFNLVVMQFFNLLSTRTRRLSIFTQSPFGKTTHNYYLVPAMAISLSLGIFFSYIPAIQKVFLTADIPAYLFFLPAAYGIGILLLDESRKYFVRRHPKSFLARIAW